jgi:hypothetical protein
MRKAGHGTKPLLVGLELLGPATDAVHYVIE